MKDKMKKYADDKRNAKPSDLKIGDTVLVKQDKQNKLSTPFNPEPYKITARNGTMITAKKDGHTITRNSSFFKQVKGGLTEDVTDEILDNTVRDKELRRSSRVKRPPDYLKIMYNKLYYFICEASETGIIIPGSHN